MEEVVEEPSAEPAAPAEPKNTLLKKVQVFWTRIIEGADSMYDNLNQDIDKEEV